MAPEEYTGEAFEGEGWVEECGTSRPFPGWCERCGDLGTLDAAGHCAECVEDLRQGFRGGIGVDRGYRD